MRLFTNEVPEAKLPKQGLSGYRSELFNSRRGSVTDVGPRTRGKLVAPSIAATAHHSPLCEERVESGLRELIADAEEHLDVLERQKVPHVLS
jgi:hypothetical protein